jgi:hypothetical protein
MTHDNDEPSGKDILFAWHLHNERHRSQLGGDAPIVQIDLRTFAEQYRRIKRS